MMLDLKQIDEARIEGLIAVANPLSVALHSLYQRAVANAGSGPRVVLLGNGRKLPEHRLSNSSKAEFDSVVELLWNVLRVDDRRVGEVICDCEPADGDYVIALEGAGYRISLPIDEAAQRLVLSA